MRKPRVLQALLFLSIILLVTVLPQASTMRGIQLASRSGEILNLYTDYRALVIGVGRHTNGWPDLPGAQKDSAEVAAALEEYGFTVKHVTNPTSRELKKEITEMAFVTGKEEHRAILLYFAGHGETLSLADGTRLGYIIPADCPLKDKDPLGFDDLAVSMKEIEALALKVRSKHVLMVFDSCFSGSLFSLVRAAPVEISEKSARAVRQFITAGNEGEQVPDRSVFKQVFLDGIKSDADLNDDGYVTGSELGMYLQTKVVNYSSGGQHPQYGKINNPRLDKGDFIFVPKATRQKETAKIEGEQMRVSEELKLLQEERKKNEELLEKLKQLLEARTKSEEVQKTGLEQKRKGAEEELRKLRTESQAAREMESGEPAEVKVAGVPREGAAPRLEKPTEEEPRLTLAILPFYPEPPPQRRAWVLKTVQLAVDRSDLFKEVYSAYEAENRPDVKPIDHALRKKEIWKRKNFFSRVEPDVELICEEAKKLGVDAAFALYRDHDRSYVYATAFMIDVARKKVYSVEGRLAWNDTTTFPDILKELLEKCRKGF